jgi:hypothetical protein
MAGSDVQSTYITADIVALDADGITTTASLSGAGTLAINGTLASTGTVTLSSGRQVTITSAGNDTGVTFTVTGTDVNGAAQTEAITGASGAAATSTKYFKTITEIANSAASAGAVTAGINALAADVVFAGRMRLRAVWVKDSATAGTLEFRQESAAGTANLKFDTIAVSSWAFRDNDIPDDGILFVGGGYVQYTVATFDTLTAFYN